MTGETNWTPALVVLGIGVLSAGGWMLVGLGRPAAAKKPKDGAGADADAARGDDPQDREYARLIEALRELENDKARVGPERYAEEKARLEQAAVAILKARAGKAQADRKDQAERKAAAAGVDAAPAPRPVQAPAPSAGFAARHPQLVGAAWGAAIVLFVALVAQTLREVGTEAPAGPAGMAGGAAPQEPAQEHPEVTAAREALARDPTDGDAAAIVSHVLIDERRYEEAGAIVRAALGKNPMHVELRTHLAVVHASEGRTEAAIDGLGAIADAYPDSHEALFFRGAIAVRAGQLEVALDAFEKFLVVAPPDMRPPDLEHAVAALRAKVAPPK